MVNCLACEDACRGARFSGVPGTANSVVPGAIAGTVIAGTAENSGDSIRICRELRVIGPMDPRLRGDDDGQLRRAFAVRRRRGSAPAIGHLSILCAKLWNPGARGESDG